MTDAAELRPAPAELAALAVAVRGWDPDDTGDAILAATQAGWTWAAILKAVYVLLLTAEADPSDLRNACRRNPARPVTDGWVPRVQAPPDASRAGLLADVRRQMDEAAERQHERRPGPGDDGRPSLLSLLKRDPL